MYGNISGCIARDADSHAGIQSSIRGHHFLNHHLTPSHMDVTRVCGLKHNGNNRNREYSYSLSFTNLPRRCCVQLVMCLLWTIHMCLSLTSVRPLCLLSQCSSGWGCPETLQNTDTRLSSDTLSCSSDTNTSGASGSRKMKRPPLAQPHWNLTKQIISKNRIRATIQELNGPKTWSIMVALLFPILLVTVQTYSP